MGLPWVRLDTGWPLNPKISDLVDLGAVGKSAAYAYAAGMCHSGAHGLDGFVPRGALRRMAITKRDTDLLVEFGLWHVEGNGGWRINDWADYQESTEETQKRADKARKAAQVRWSKHASGNARSITRGNAEENRTEENTKNRMRLPLDEGSPNVTRATGEAR
jgi:hypothetical protein